MKRCGLFKKHSEIVILLIIMVAVILIMSALNPTRFMKLSNFQSMAFQMPELGLLSLAMMITMLSGGINLSIISSANLSGIITAIILIKYATPKAGSLTVVPFILTAIAAGFAVSIVIGLANGLLIARVGVSPILATLGMMTFVNGLTIVTTGGYTLSGFPPSIAFIGNGVIAGFPMPLLIFIACSLLLSLVLNRMALGFDIYMLGSNWLATLFSGVNNAAVLIKTYLISGLLAGAASLIMISRFNSAKSGYGEGYLLITILAAVLGGTSTTGGFGKVSGLVIALIILQIISSGLNLMGVSAFFTLSMWGLIIILVMAANFISVKYQQKKRKTFKRV
ncbi:MAG: sugar ABC transporter permease [Spirochaetes bacterium DG_61]|nr:MAG: sugar ABC transporter permease [Spirochaetes bacterium DG_61]